MITDVQKIEKAKYLINNILKIKINEDLTASAEYDERSLSAEDAELLLTEFIKSINDHYNSINENKSE
jgi:hypothetical protein